MSESKHTPPRWYCVDRDGVAMLCAHERDARAQVAENDYCWPGRAPHRAVLMGDVSDLAAEVERLQRRVADMEALATQALAHLEDQFGAATLVADLRSALSEKP